MTRRTNARIAGYTFLVYIATAITSMVISGRAIGDAEETATKLANIAQHASLMRLDVLLTLLCAASALVLAVTLYSLTRDQDRDLALIALCCRAGEGLVIVALSTLYIMALLSVASASTQATGADAASDNALGALLFNLGDKIGTVAATCFAVGSLFFSWLFLRGRMIPVALAWLGVLASVLSVICLPMQLTGLLGDPVTTYMWYPMLLFEVVLGLWLIIKGASEPALRQSASH